VLIAIVGASLLVGACCAIAARKKASEQLTVVPIIVPIVIAGARGTAQLLDLKPDLEGARFWTQFLLALDILFITAGMWAFEPVVGAD
jgi:ABC-type transport system involved in cytochrome c biogenesis permease component